MKWRDELRLVQEGLKCGRGLSAAIMPVRLSD
jgi:hypothetical protein